jgi:hypothetical protein
LTSNPYNLDRINTRISNAPAALQPQLGDLRDQWSAGLIDNQQLLSQARTLYNQQQFPQQPTRPAAPTAPAPTGTDAGRGQGFNFAQQIGPAAPQAPSDSMTRWLQNALAQQWLARQRQRQRPRQAPAAQTGGGYQVAPQYQGLYQPQQAAAPAVMPTTYY